MKLKLNKIAIFSLLLTIGFASCVPQKKMLYLKDVQMAEANISKEYINERSFNYRLQPGDNLYIRAINTIDERAAAAINGDIGSASTQMNGDGAIYLRSYTVDEEGYIELPLIGRIDVKNMTVDEAKNKLQEELNKFVNQTMLIVKLSNFNLTMIGEVSRPGMYKVYQAQINLFEAISMAGNMTSFAKRDQVRIIRQTDNGSKVVTVDMGMADILESPYYYLKPNDIIYVEPLKIKQWGFTTFPYSTVLSVVSLAFTLYLAFKK